MSNYWPGTPPITLKNKKTIMTLMTMTAMMTMMLMTMKSSAMWQIVNEQMRTAKIPRKGKKREKRAGEEGGDEGNKKRLEMSNGNRAM